MSKNEYLSLLGNNLRSLTVDEYSNVMQYYEEYFEDAGVDNEQKVIDELGSPEDLAAKIVSESVERSIQPRWQASSDQNNNSSSYDQSNEQNNNQDRGYTNGGENNRYDYRENEPQKRRMSPVVIALIIILGFPLWIGIAGVAFGIICGIFGILFGFGVATIALFGATVVTFVVSIATFFSSPATGVVGLGATFIVLSIALGFLMLTVLVIKVISSVCKAIFGRRRS